MTKMNKQAIFQNASRIGIMGGTFDPIHYGHLTAAECIRYEKNLDLILFIPTGQPPHKSTQTASFHRYLMTCLAVSDNKYFEVSRIEVDRPDFSYTIDTIRILKEKTSAELYFIIGMDEMLKFHSWKDADQLKDLCNWVPVTRPGYKPVKHSPDRFSPPIIEIPGLDISGTALRERIKNNEPIKYLTHPAVEQYITEMGLYSKESDFYSKIHQAVSSKLSAKRYRHTLGVIETAVLLATRYGINIRKAYLSALLHDYAKELSEGEMRKLCNKFNIQIDAIQDKIIYIMHGHLSAELARHEFGIDDPEILEAISFHTTGRAGMGSLAQILKIADNIEPTRPDFPGLDEIKALSSVNLNRAIAASLNRDLEYTRSKGQIIHPWGLEALEYFKEMLD